MGIRNRFIATVPLSGRFRSPFGCCQGALQPFFAFNLSMLNQSSQAVEALTPNFSAQLQENQRCTQSFLLTPLLGRLQDPTDCAVHQERSSCQAKRSENKSRWVCENQTRYDEGYMKYVASLVGERIEGFLFQYYLFYRLSGLCENEELWSLVVVVVS